MKVKQEKFLNEDSVAGSKLKKCKISIFLLCAYGFLRNVLIPFLSCLYSHSEDDHRKSMGTKRLFKAL